MNTSKLSMVLLLLVSLAVAVNAVPVANLEVEVDGHEVDNIASATNRLDLVRGQDFQVKVAFDATGDSDNMEVEAFISGYEFNDVDSISDTTGIFAVETNVTYVKRLTLTLPNDVDEDDYLLRVLITDRNGVSHLEEFRLKLDVPRSSMRIDDVVFNPESEVKAGRSLLTLVRVENAGERDQDGVKVTASIADLQVSASDYIDEVEAGDEVTSEALYFRLPACAEAGTYNVDVTLSYDSGRRSEKKSVPIKVVADERCAAATAGQPEKTVLSLGAGSQSVDAGATASFPVTLTNAGTTTKTYSLAVEGADGFASVKMTPSNVVVLNAGETQTVYVGVTPLQNAAAGAHSFVVSVRQNNEVLKALSATLTVNAAASADAPATSFDKVKNGLEIGLVVLLVLLVVIGLIVAFNKMKSDEDEEDAPSSESGQTYY